MIKNETLSIVIPVYNEASSLIQLYEEIKVNVASFFIWEILFVDDGSTDDSGEIIRSLHEKDKRVKLIQFHRNYGKSAALSEGFKIATGNYILTMFSNLINDQYLTDAHTCYKVIRKDNTPKLHSMKMWHVNIKDGAYQEFKEISEKYVFTSGEGLPGLVFEAKAVQTIYDVTKDANFPRANLAKNIGVRGAFAFPLIIDGAVEYVLEFFSPEPEHLDPSVLELLKIASTQLSKRLSGND